MRQRKVVRFRSKGQVSACLCACCSCLLVAAERLRANALRCWHAGPTAGAPVCQVSDQAQCKGSDLAPLLPQSSGAGCLERAKRLKRSGNSCL
jgi:hypothetical protein